MKLPRILFLWLIGAAAAPMPGFAGAGGGCAASYARLAPRPAAEFSDEIVGGEWSGLKLKLMNSHSANQVYTAKNSRGQTVAIFKPASPVAKWDWLSLKQSYEAGSDLVRNEASYRVSEALGFKVVPKSGNAFTKNGMHGSVDAFLTGFKDGSEIAPEILAKVPPSEAQKMYLLDAILGGQDRHIRNWMVGPKGEFQVIDNGNTLAKTAKKRWGFFTDPQKYFPQAVGKIDPALKAMVFQFSDEKLAKSLEGLAVPGDAIRLAKIRLAALKGMLEDDASLVDIASAFNRVAFLSNRNLQIVGVGFGVGALGLGAGYGAEEWRK